MNIKNIIEWEVLTPAGWSDFSAIKKIQKDKYLKIIFDNANYIECSLNHKLKLNDGTFKYANDLQINDILFTGEKIIEKILINEIVDLYDLLDVELNNEYYTNDVVSHNCAFILGFEDKWAAIQQTLGTGGGCCMLSTPNGYGNVFHKLYTEAETGLNSFVPIKLHWSVHPDRDQSWRDSQDELIGERLARQECDVSFLSSGNTVIEPQLLEWYRSQICNPVEKRGVNSSYWIWEYPDYSEQYVVCADVARGDGNDYSAAHVIKLSTMTQVAEFKDKIATKEYGNVLVTIATEYNNAYLAVENANIGWNVLQTIIDLNYTNLHYTTKADMGATSMGAYISKGIDLKDQNDLVPGFTTSSRTRPLMINNLENLMREKMVVIKSQRLWDELSVFVYLSGGKAAAQNGYNDDLVMSFAIGLWLRETAIKFKSEAMAITSNALSVLASNAKPTYEAGVYSSIQGKQNPWEHKQGKHTIDLTQFI